MINENYSKAFKEVYMILNSFGNEITDKIPRSFLEFIETNMDREYFFMLDNTIEIEKQSFMEETLGIISVIWRDYICSDEEKHRVQLEDAKKQLKIEKEINERYIPDNLFKINMKEETALVKLREDNFFDKIMKFFKNIFFHKKN